ncbi:MAG: DEDD exonuclease domain-containing protein [Acidobacteria bacterium]|nr:DEDD exonuclease domain-containing protein [Acidobacteriota bacterium]
MHQRRFEDLGTPLAETTFCVLDLETTGGSPADSRITEIGAVKVRGGDVFAEFQTLVNPETSIPSFITMLTGITDAMVAPAPPIRAVLPAFLEFLGGDVVVAHNASFDMLTGITDAMVAPAPPIRPVLPAFPELLGGDVVVAHNASFDRRFLRASATAYGYGTLDNPVVCTLRLARRLVRDEVPNLRLETLAAALRAGTSPAHRALADARAACDVFHALLELAGRWGVTHLDDLLRFQGARGHPQYRKTRLADALPRARGVYLFRDSAGEVLYVGKATNLRERVRQYFSSDDRRRIGDLLREMEAVDHMTCATDLEASVLEARLIRHHAPPFNHAGRGRARPRLLSLTRERFPRLAVSRGVEGAAWSGADDLGPLLRPVADAVREALEEASAIRACSERLGPQAHFPACVLGQIGRCPAPCEGRATPEEYAARLFPVRSALEGSPAAALAALAGRMERHAARGRFEEAAATRGRIEALVEASRRSRAVQALVRAGAVRVAIGDAGPAAVVEIRDGVVERAGGRALPVPSDGHPDEPRLVAAWLARNRARARVLQAERDWALPVAGGRALEEWVLRLGACREEARDSDARRERRARRSARAPTAV